MALSVHLLVCIHGLWGNPDHLAELARFIRANYPLARNNDIIPGIEVDILVATSNTDNWTYDGIDWGAERVAREVEAHINDIQANGTHKVTRFSVIGYSLGGLLARYLVGIFHSHGVFRDIEPCNFVTIATPHVGLPRYPGFLSACFNSFSPRLLSRSGKQLSLRDKWSSSKQPILQVMADKEKIFFKALSLFPHIHIYANAVKDTAVPYLTGAIELEDPFLTYESNGLQIELDEQYKPIIKSFTLPEMPVRPPPRPRLFSVAFLRSLRPTPLLLPVSFPIQLLIWMFVPILFPLLMSYIIVRLSLDSRASKARIKDLEKADTSAATLLHSIRALEKHAENAVADLIDEPSAAPASSSRSVKQHRSQPSLTPMQRSLVASLSSLQQIRKHLAFISGVLNSHAVIICRDVQRIEVHRRGEGVLQHVADNLVL